MRAQVKKAQLLAGRPQEPVFHEEDVPVEAEEQPDWVNVYAGQNQRYEGIERDFYDDDGGDDYDWTSTSINIPQGKDPKTWLQDAVRDDEEHTGRGLWWTGITRCMSTVP